MQSNIDILWIIIAAALVMFMQAGFTALESGLTRAKNSINVAMKNITDFIVSILIFFLVGYALMFGQGNSFMGWSGFALDGHNTPADYAMFVFQATFAGTAATIISGAVAERIRFTAYILVSVLVCAVIYPVSGHWIWHAEGWLAQKQMVDFAGSSVVHSLGGWVGLAGALILGPRLGRFSATKANKLHSHNLVLAVVGVIVLWFGWIGFNGGSLLKVGPEIAVIVANTMIAASAGGLGCFLTSAIVHKGEIQIEKLLNGVVGGLVAVTAGCAVVEPAGAIWLGLLGGIIVFFSEEFVLHVLKIDDPVNVISAHGVAGAWGTIGLALFAPVDNLPLKDIWAQLGVQCIGAVAIFAWGFGSGLLIFWLLKVSNFLRVSPEAEKVGLNVHEHGASSGLLQTMEAMDSIVRAYNGSGNSDLTHRIEVETGSEAGEIADTFNCLMDAFHDSIYDIKQCANEISAAANLMTQSSEEMEAESVTNSERLAGIASSIKAMCESLNRTRRFTDDIVTLAQHASQAAHDGTQQVNATFGVIDKLKQQIIQSRGTIDQLVRQTSKVGGILESINSISDQTNLLALNATIEAARAGEAGRGFAVVADEVRSLSSRTQAATREIRALMSELAGLADNASQEMDACTRQSDQGMDQVQATSRSFDDIAQQVTQIHTASSGVRAAAAQQDEKVSDVSAGLDQLNQVRQRTATRAQETRVASTHLTGLAESLTRKLGGLRVGDGATLAP